MKIIIVHINERTVDLARESAEYQIGEENVYLVSARSFNKSMSLSFEIAIQEKLEWIILMGGDQMLQDHAVQKLENTISAADKNVFRVSGYGHDRLLMRRRMMAPSIYRVSLLGEALNINTNGQNRPESHILYEMKKKDHPFIIIDETLAIHDMSQYYRDIYRKGCFEASKSMKYITDEGIIGELKQSNNPDHEIFLLGINDFIENKRRTPKEAMELLNLTEKEAL